MLAIGRILRTGATHAAARRADRGSGSGHHPADRPHIAKLKREGFTILLVEQNFRFAATVADRHYVVEHGKVVDMIPNGELDANRRKLHSYLGV
jgi:branched-chain amino acid transport system ATP-binding protein